MDLPAASRAVNIQLLVRRFRCRNPACRRRVFAERFPQLVRPHARRTERLESLLTRIGVLLGGEAGARLSQDLHVPVSPGTMLRLLYRTELTPAAGVRVVGIDEWAWRKGLRYGTIDCVRLGGRSSCGAAAGSTGRKCRTMASRTSRHIEVVSRDRAGVFGPRRRVGRHGAVRWANDGRRSDAGEMWEHWCMSALPLRRSGERRRRRERIPPEGGCPQNGKPARTRSAATGSGGG